MTNIISEDDKIERIETLVKSFRAYYINALHQYSDKDYNWAHEGEMICNMILDEIDKVKDE